LHYDLEKVWQQAITDTNSANLDTRWEQARLYYGIKIVNRDGQISIYNTTVGEDYYIEITGSEYLIFEHDGWRVGCWKMVLENCIERLDVVERKIRYDTNNKRSLKTVQRLKDERERIMNNYRITTNKINKYGNN